MKLFIVRTPETLPGRNSGTTLKGNCTDFKHQSLFTGLRSPSRGERTSIDFCVSSGRYVTSDELSQVISLKARATLSAAINKTSVSVK